MSEQRCPNCNEPDTGDLDEHLGNDCTEYDDNEDEEEEQGEC